MKEAKSHWHRGGTFLHPQGIGMGSPLGAGGGGQEVLMVVLPLSSGSGFLHTGHAHAVDQQPADLMSMHTS